MTWNPDDRRKAGKRDLRPWTPEEDAYIRAARADNIAWRVIAKELGRGYDATSQRGQKLDLVGYRPQRSKPGCIAPNPFPPNCFEDVRLKPPRALRGKAR